MRRQRLLFPILLPLLLLLLLLFPPSLFALPQRETTPPDKHRVAEVLEQLKAEETTALREASRQEHVFKRLGVWLQSGAFYIRLSVFCGVLFILLLIGYRLFRFFTARLRQRIKPAERRSLGNDRREFNSGHIAQLEKRERFAQALLYLHRMSIEYLLDHKLLQSANLTNRTIVDRLRDKGMASAFKTIATTSEKVLFDRLELTRERYLPCRRAFNKTFGSGI